MYTNCRELDGVRGIHTQVSLTTDSEGSHLRFFLSHWFSQPRLLSLDTANFFCFRTGALPIGLRLTVTGK